MHAVVDALLVLGAKKLRDDNARPGAKAGEQPDHQVDDGGAGAHRRQGVGADVVAHHDRIHRVVKLLEQVAQQQRQREQQQLLPDDALGHQSLVLLHLDPSFSSKSLSPWGGSFYRPGKAFSYSRLKCHICEK